MLDVLNTNKIGITTSTTCVLHTRPNDSLIASTLLCADKADILAEVWSEIATVTLTPSCEHAKVLNVLGYEQNEKSPA